MGNLAAPGSGDGLGNAQIVWGSGEITHCGSHALNKRNAKRRERGRAPNLRWRRNIQGWEFGLVLRFFWGEGEKEAIIMGIWRGRGDCGSRSTEKKGFPG